MTRLSRIKRLEGLNKNNTPLLQPVIYYYGPGEPEPPKFDEPRLVIGLPNEAECERQETEAKRKREEYEKKHDKG